MKVTPDDPALTAYVLGELDESMSSKVAKAVDSDERLQNELEEIELLSGLLGDTLGGSELSLGEDRIAEIHRSAARPDSELIVLDHEKRSRRQSLLAVAGVAAVVALGFVVLSRFNVDQASGTVGSDVASAGGVTSGGAAVPAGDSADLPGGFRPDSNNLVALPLQVGRADASIVERSLESDGLLPDRDQFLVANWINLGAAAGNPQMEIDGLKVWSELGPCTWNPTSSLLMVRLEPTNGKSLSLETALEFDANKVREVQLAGGAGEAAEAPSVSGQLKGPKTFLYEVALTDEPGPLGNLRFVVNEGEPRQLSLGGEAGSQSEVSTAFSTAVILGDFARWGASEGRDRETLVRLSREAKELLAKVSDNSTRYALDMILMSEEALEKANEGE